MKSNFSQIPNHCLEDKSLSFAARGLLSYMISRPSDWTFYVEHLAKQYAKGSKETIRKLLKELRDGGYVLYGRVRDDNSNKFVGTRYSVNSRIFSDSHKTQSGKLVQPEIRDSRPLENPNIGNSERRDSSNHNKKEISNKDSLTIQDYQQQKKQVDAVVGDIDNFFQGLLQDETWKNSFQNELLGDRLITSLEFELILFQFREHALRKNEGYTDAQGAKYHFLNWFNTQKDKVILQSKLQKEKQKQAELTKNAAATTIKVSKLVDIYNEKAFPSNEKVLEAKLMLASSFASLTDLLKAIQDREARGIIETTLDTARKLIDLIERASEKNELGWFCTNAKLSN